MPQNDAGDVINQVENVLDELAQKFYEQDKLQLTIGIQKIVSETGINERTLRQNGYPRTLSDKHPGITYVPYKGLRIRLEPYLEGRNLIETEE